MKTDDGVIIEATIEELRDLWLRDEYYKEISFFEFVERCKAQGTKII